MNPTIVKFIGNIIHAELQETCRMLCTPSKGILAVDETTGKSFYHRSVFFFLNKILHFQKRLESVFPIWVWKIMKRIEENIGNFYFKLMVFNQIPCMFTWLILINLTGIENYISGVILNEETLFQQLDNISSVHKTSVPEYLKDKGICVGIKV